MNAKPVAIASIGFVLWVSGCAGPDRTSLLNAQEVLRECGKTDVTSPRVAAWAEDGSAAAVVGMRGNIHVLVIAHRHPASPNPNLQQWTVAETSIMMRDGHDIWIVGEEEFPNPPTKKDILELCTRLLWDKPESCLNHWKMKE